MSKKKVLVVDRNPAFTLEVVKRLQDIGYYVLALHDGEQVIRTVEIELPDLIIMDISLPNITGDTITRSIRRHRNKDVSGIPIIILSARSTEKDKISLFEIGADDYIVKPPSWGELFARASAVLRRGAIVQKSEYTCGALTVIPEQYKAYVDGCELQLRPKEFLILLTLMSNPARVLTRDEILRRVWGFDHGINDYRTIDVHVRQIRMSIEEDPSNPRYITTVKGVGYRFDG